MSNAELEIYEKVLLNLLEETEGMFIMYEDSKCLVVKTLNKIEIYDATDMPEFKENESIWFHLESDMN